MRGADADGGAPARRAAVPTYGLYGERPEPAPDFWLHAETIPARSRLHDWEIRPHRHAGFLQILLLEAGTGDAMFGEATYPLVPPVAVTVPVGCEHGFRFAPDADGTVITVLARRLRPGLGEGGRLRNWLAGPGVIPLAAAPMGPATDGASDAAADAAHAHATLRRLGREARARRGADDLMDGYLAVALALLSRLSRRADARADEADGRLERLDTLLRRHVRAHRPATFYAQELGVTLTHLSRLVRAATGHGVQELIARMLEEEAKADLIFTRASLQEVGYRLGFSDPAYFSRFFRRRTGSTPGRFRRDEQARLGM